MSWSSWVVLNTIRDQKSGLLKPSISLDGLVGEHVEQLRLASDAPPPTYVDLGRGTSAE